MKKISGFTLIELLVVVLIIGILASMAMPQYFKAVERSRMTEAVELMNTISQAQRRKFLQLNKYATDYRALDVVPKDASGTLYYTKGDPATGAGGNGFAVALLNNGLFTHGNVKVDRFASSGGLQYRYNLRRYYQNDKVTCQGVNKAGQELCRDFCGTEELSGSGYCCSDGTSTSCPMPKDN